MDDLDELLHALEASKSLYPGTETKEMANYTKPSNGLQREDSDYDLPPNDIIETPKKTNSLKTKNNNDSNTNLTPLQKNLRELDNLLDDLSSRQFLDQISKNDEIYENVNNSIKVNNSPALTNGSSVKPGKLLRPNSSGGNSSGNSSHTTLSATQELDTLLESLSDFQINQTAFTNDKPVEIDEQIVDLQSNNDGNQLDNMLGNLKVDLDKQGIKLVEKGLCPACDQPIIGQVITALGFMWHPEHFLCHHCNMVLGTNTFFERDGKPFCETDYHLLYSPQCACCAEPILDHCVTALDKTFHPDCFVCTVCKKPFGKDGFYEKDSNPYCKEDYFDTFVPKCFGCKNVLQDNYISALNQHWHPQCFVCQTCRKPFDNGPFLENDGLPYCEKDFHISRGSVCGDCTEPITGRCITALGKKFHPQCFKCNYCCHALNKGTFKEREGKPFCHSCYVRLYCAR